MEIKLTNTKQTITNANAKPTVIKTNKTKTSNIKLTNTIPAKNDLTNTKTSSTK